MIRKLSEGGKKKVYLVGDKVLVLARDAGFALIKTENLNEDVRKKFNRFEGFQTMYK